MQTIIRHSQWVTSAAAILLVLAGCGRSDRETGAAAAGVGDTSMATTTGAPAENLDPDRADDQVEDALRADSMLARFQLDADDEGEGIEIEGTVATEAQKARAAEIVAGAAPGISLNNQVRVDAGARREAADDAADEAEDRVEEAFDADTTLEALDLDADDEDGRLVLEGTVRTAAQRTQAEAVAKEAAGGVRLENRIKVKQ